MAGGTDFFLQIEAEMRGAAGAVGELQELAEGVDFAKKKYADFERASLGTGKALEAVGGKIATLRERMAKSMAAGDMQSFWKDGGKLNALVGQEEKLKVKADGAKRALEGQGQALTKLASQYGKLKTATDEQAGATSRIEVRAKSFQRSGDALGKLGGPLGRLGQRAKDVSEGWHDLSGTLGKGGAAAALAAVAIVAVAAALVAGAVAAGKWALGMANSSRNLGLTLEAMAGGPAAGQALAKTFGSVTEATGIASDRLLDLSRDLKKANVSAADMPAALRAIAMQEQALGDSSGTADLVEALKNGKTSAAAMADEMESKFGGVVAKKIRGLDQLTVRFKQHLSNLFEGGNSEELFAGLEKTMHAVVAGAQGLKVILVSMFAGLDWETTFIAVEAFIYGAIIGAKKLYIAVLDVSEALGLDDIGKGFKDFPSAASLGSAAAFILLTPILLIGAAAAAAAIHLDTMMKGAKALKDIGVGLGDTKIKTRMGGEKPADETAKFTESGANAGKGWIAGLKGMSGAATVAGGLFGAAAHAGYKYAVQENSPPKLWINSGKFAAEGYTMGLEHGAPAANDAAAALGQPPALNATASATAATPAGNVSIVINVNITGTTEKPLTTDDITDALTDALEQAGLRAGAASGVAA